MTAGFAAYAVLMLPNVDPWHTIRLKGEFTERDGDGLDFAGYQAIEAKLFEQERKAIAEMPKDAPFYVGSRYDPNGPGAAPRSRTALQPQHPTHAGAGPRRRAPDPRPVGWAVLGPDPR